MFSVDVIMAAFAVANAGTPASPPARPVIAIPAATTPTLPAAIGAPGQSGATTPIPAWAGTTPTFQQVLAAPDDPALNIAYANDQAAKGHLLAAAAAFERILLEAPDNDTVRLMYIDILLKLDDPSGASREVAKLDPITLSDTDRGTLQALNGRLAALQASLPPGNVAQPAVTK